MIEYECEYEPNIMISGILEEHDESYDHEFGIEKRVSYKVSNFQVIAIIETSLINIESLIEKKNPSSIDKLKDFLINSYIDESAADVYSIV